MVNCKTNGTPLGDVDSSYRDDYNDRYGNHSGELIAAAAAAAAVRVTADHDGDHCRAHQGPLASKQPFRWSSLFFGTTKGTITRTTTGRLGTIRDHSFPEEF